jgi:2-methylcitrate dehydratase PrpD
LRTRGVTPDQISELRLGIPAQALRTIAEPASEKARPATGYAGAFSGAYTVAAALFGGGGLGLGMRDFTDEAAARPEVLALAAKVSVEPDAECSAIFPHQFPARLTALLRDGRTEEAFRAANRGGPLQPLTDAELEQKFATNAETVCTPYEAERIARQVRAMAGGATARSVGTLLRGLGR